MEKETGRLHSIDWLRGAVMVLMALDHVRDYFGLLANPTDVTQASPALFLTRWVTHFCAPVFVLLAGVSAFLYGAKPGRSRAELSRFLFTRGVWLVLLELTVVTWVWAQSLSILFWQVIAVLGVSMILLALLVWLPRNAILAFALLMIFGHNALDGITIERMGEWGTAWRFAHAGIFAGGFGFERLFGVPFLVVYPAIPWVGVMALGYALGPIVLAERRRRRATFLWIGLAATALFFVVRTINAHGNAWPWSVQESGVRTAMSFFNALKYPPSLGYLAMTLGPSLVVLALVDREPKPGGRAGLTSRFFVPFGRVPLFYYIAHLALIVLASRLFYWVRCGEPVNVIASQMTTGTVPEGCRGLPLVGVWLAWLAVVAALYPLCAWYAGVKQRSRSRLLSYL